MNLYHRLSFGLVFPLQERLKGRCKLIAQSL